ncbi:hypothetical protein VTJ04DRAFT_7991 [Mycothermus thermophilus]|uniref:uncharacterized protein n=1 Tax=Humicola insolens TaxID=85995 RepID=UPI003743AFEC
MEQHPLHCTVFLTHPLTVQMTYPSKPNNIGSAVRTLPSISKQTSTHQPVHISVFPLFYPSPRETNTYFVPLTYLPSQKEPPARR